MDGGCFDSLTRLAGATGSRRKALGAIAAAGAGGALALVGIETALADCTARRRTCRSVGECCGRSGEVNCARITRECDRNRLRRGQRCCRQGGASCDSTCDCCDPFVCLRTPNGRRCVQSTSGFTAEDGATDAAAEGSSGE